MTKKEIGMEKLMKYVEEMQKEGINICRPRFQEYYLLEMMLVSKHYGLIKWLVKKDKIDFDKVENKFYNEICITDYGDKNRAYGKSDLVISMLSISDTPIEDLISYLK